MKFLTLISLLLFQCGSLLAQNSPQNIRSRFENASSEEDFKWIIQAEIKTSNPEEQNIVNSYKAVSQSAMAQYVFSPYTKFKYFFTGRDQLESCISVQKNLENIFLRLVVQLSIPQFLGYSENIKEDLFYVKQNITQADVPLETKRFIVNTIINTENSNYDLQSLLDINLE